MHWSSLLVRSARRGRRLGWRRYCAPCSASAAGSSRPPPALDRLGRPRHAPQSYSAPSPRFVQGTSGGSPAEGYFL